MVENYSKPVTLQTFTSGLDAYGVPSTVVASERVVDMATFIYSQTPVSDPRFNDCELVGLTKDNNITDKNLIKIGTTTYHIINILPTKRYNRILMKRDK